MLNNQDQQKEPGKTDKEKDDHKVREQVETVTPDTENSEPDADEGKQQEKKED